jgi:hypothetical protein
MTKRITWEEFRSTGLLLIVNQILHIFGIALVFEFNDDKTLKEVYPARVKFRGFDIKSTTESYIKVSEYIKNNADELLEESKS